MPREFQNLTPNEIRALSREKTVFFICVGPLADFGDHLTVDAPLRTARKLAEETALRVEAQSSGVECILLPPLPLCVSTANSLLALNVRSHVLRDALVDQCQGLYRLGFRWFVCFSDERSPQQLTVIEEAGKFLWSRTSGWRGWLGRWVESVPGVGSSRATLVSACSALVERSELWRAPLWPDPLENGGEVDTSRLLASDPSAVRKEYQALSGLPRADLRMKRFTDWWKSRRQGYWGNPSTASQEKGLTLIQNEASTVAAKLRAVLDGSPGHVVFRSGYALFPTNSSVFGVWIMTLALFLLLLTWVYWSVRWMVQGVDG